MRQRHLSVDSHHPYHADAYSHSFTLAHGHDHPRAYGDTHAYAYTDADAHTHANAYTHANANANAHTHANTHAHANAHANAHADAHANAHAHAHANANAGGVALCWRWRPTGCESPAATRAPVSSRPSSPSTVRGQSIPRRRAAIWIRVAPREERPASEEDGLETTVLCQAVAIPEATRCLVLVGGRPIALLVTSLSLY
jgi:hypothetical protein